MLSRSEASPRRTRQTFRFASLTITNGESIKPAYVVMLSRSEASRPACEILRGVYPERSEWAQDDKHGGNLG
jgi:hypothetical protein